MTILYNKIDTKNQGNIIKPSADQLPKEFARC
jgi:hypothetical protein